MKIPERTYDNMPQRLKTHIILLLGTLLLRYPASTLSYAAYPDVSEELFVMARHLWTPVELQSVGYADFALDPNESQQRLRMATLLLQAAVEMNPANTQAAYDLMLLFMAPAINDPGRAMDALINYSDLEKEDQRPVAEWLSYRLDSLQQRMLREYFLQQNIPQLNNYPYVLSEAWTELGILTNEKGDLEFARQCFTQAFNASNYNYHSLKLLLDLPPAPVQKPDNAPPDWEKNQKKNQEEVQHLQTIIYHRLQLRTNPYNLAATINLINTLENYGFMQMAQEYYKHAYTLINLMPENEEMKNELQLKQLLSAYNLEQYRECLSIAQNALQDKPDDILINALMAMTMKKLSMSDEAEYILQKTLDNNLEILKNYNQLVSTQPENHPETQTALNNLHAELAWFFCFFKPDPLRALEFSQRVHQTSPDDPRAINTLAYALTLNSQWEQAAQ
ncbi:MAG: hypothetical protein JW860_09915, partial [Sedimentisphaerales bacterium]|nr:hypothetical protein [Sedimentisphaerales bacterium]